VKLEKESGATTTFIGCREKFSHCKLAGKLPPAISIYHHRETVLLERKIDTYIHRVLERKREKIIKPKGKEEYNALPRVHISRKLLSLCAQS
jgi:hypothetical protein